MTASKKVRFHANVRLIQLRNRNALKRFIINLFKRERKALSAIDYIFCNDEELLQLNRTHLNHDYFTDIITFDLSDTTATIAEVYISVDRVRENARVFEVSFTEELHRVIFHGALHLCGYKDKQKKDKELMTAKESEYLRLYFK